MLQGVFQKIHLIQNKSKHWSVFLFKYFSFDGIVSVYEAFWMKMSQNSFSFAIIINKEEKNDETYFQHQHLLCIR